MIWKISGIENETSGAVSLVLGNVNNEIYFDISSEKALSQQSDNMDINIQDREETVGTY